ncbi:hypothetical protein [Aequorivita viscosa]|uniref:Uncharacterized protein n=1 Tax=Aequorivita viscosa TaxID=797419 RepID=A0A1M6KKJ9_9FLAO|nr:hypothetical protein [Aequorivita viscosa]SDX19287.1 hypothetical protein SAMN05216556_1207 [Aequorivita viscosa]SHJ59465.1 hypothetical protein SAMN04487908_12065 [Aequorivita viscosa]
MEYEISKRLRASIQKEIEGKGHHNRKVIFGAMAKEVFKDIRSTAILTGDKVEMFSF